MGRTRRVLGLTIGVLVLARPSAGQDGWFRASLVAAVAGHGADLASTEYCLGAGRCQEGNPGLARFRSPVVFGVVKMGIAAGSLVGTVRLHETHPRLAQAINWGIAGGFLAIGIRNGRVAGEPR